MSRNAQIFKGCGQGKSTFWRSSCTEFSLPSVTCMSWGFWILLFISYYTQYSPGYCRYQDKLIPAECLRCDFGKLSTGLPCEQIPTQEQGYEPPECRVISLRAGLFLCLLHRFSSWFSDHVEHLWLSGLKSALSHPWLHNWARCSLTCLHWSVYLFYLVWDRVHFSLAYKWWKKDKQISIFNAQRSLTSSSSSFFFIMASATVSANSGVADLPVEHTMLKSKEC